MTEIGARTFYHGTKAELKPGNMLQGGYSSNYTERRSPWIYFIETVFAATWGAELANRSLSVVRGPADRSVIPLKGRYRVSSQFPARYNAK